MATEIIGKDYAHSEGRIAKRIEEQTAKLPSDAFLWMAVGAMATSATLQVTSDHIVERKVLSIRS